MKRSDNDGDDGNDDDAGDDGYDYKRCWDENYGGDDDVMMRVQSQNTLADWVGPSTKNTPT